VKKPNWLRWRSDSTKSDNLKKVRQRTDQMIKHQEAQKKLQPLSRMRPPIQNVTSMSPHVVRDAMTWPRLEAEFDPGRDFAEPTCASTCAVDEPLSRQPPFAG